MTINEAIIYAEEMAATDGNRKRQDNYNQIAEWLKDYKRMLQQEPCEDCISRQAVIDGIKNYFHDEYYQRTSIQDCRDCLIEDMIKGMPPVTPQPKTGHWIDDEFGSKCSCCGFYTHLDKFERPMKFKCCSMCGAKMVEPQESEVTYVDSH